MGRYQCTVINGVSSPLLPVVSGVPQGSVLGPILFSLFVNDLPNYITLSHPLLPISLKLFADDLKSYYVVDTLIDAIDFQSVINSIHTWCDIWQLSINVNKCSTLHLGSSNSHFVYGLNGIPLSSPGLVKDLGLLLDESLKFTPHISAIISKARSRCGIFLKSFVSRDPQVMKRFFVVYVRPLLEYAGVVWNPISKTNIHSLEKVLRYFTNLIPTCRFLPYKRRLTILSLDSLELRRKILDLAYLYSLVTGSIDLTLSDYLIHIPPSITRGHNLKIKRPSVRYSATMCNFLSRTVPTWNTLPPSFFNSTSRSSFKKSLLKFLPDPCK